MTLPVFGDRVQEIFNTTGTGTISLGGAVAGYQPFSGAVTNGQTCYYGATDGTNWEVGIGTYASSGNTLARTTVIASSNSNSAVNWQAGTKTIWIDLAASWLTTPQVPTQSPGDNTTNAANTAFVTAAVAAAVGGGFLAKAWASVTGSSGAVLASMGVSSVVRNSAGNYTVNFSNNAPSVHYAVLMTGQGISSPGNIVNLPFVGGSFTKNVGSVVVETFSGVNGNSDINFDIAVFY